jgi:hypothetical protein
MSLNRRPFSVAFAAAGIVFGTLAPTVPDGSAAPQAAAASSAAPLGPAIRLVTAQREITVSQSGNSVLLDPGIWVGISGSALRFDVGRQNYSKPLTITQIITRPGMPPEVRPLPASILDGWNGLKDFIRLTVTDSEGRVVNTSAVTMCPNSYDPEPVAPDSTGADPYPLWCLAADPFEIATVWGTPAGWAVDPTEVTSYPMQLAVGTYTVTESITTKYIQLFHIPSHNATATVTVTVVRGQADSAGVLGRQAVAGPTPGGPTPGGRAPGSRTLTGPAQSTSPGQLTQAPQMKNPPTSALPDLVPMPAWLIKAVNVSGSDLLEFGATVWDGGNGPLDVEGFRVNGSPVMPAYQYFWQNGHVIGRVRAGTMGFDSQPGHDHWHFQQFAQYQLLGANKELVLRSQKVGFCIGPSDPVDLVLPQASWRPALVGLSGQCGSPTALWVQETLPVGWGDTYVQSLARQAFDVTSVPNGTYYIEIITNPMHILRETNTGNDISLRKVILTGPPGHRHATAPAWNGIDPEG